ncbi:uncharacterized protein LOC108030042 [Drosophila biarmipes]|uniref:uncharacterized protein LOC108030042 n=1 Tax=Drosophila biarmipes TaxID=125945 RepID=UPI0007E76AFA|nr:uncharacterized protein LOC108030042 [Drosophila biarmipes]
MCSSSTDLRIKENTFTSDSSIHSDGLANEVIDNILKEHPGRGIHQESSSLAPSCSFPSEKSKNKVDHRLDYWKNMIRQRWALQERLRRQLGRIPEQMILNCQGKVVSHSVRGLMEIVGIPRYTAAELLGREGSRNGEKDDDCSKEPPPKICDLEVLGRKYEDCRDVILRPMAAIKESSPALSRSSGGGEVVQPIQSIQQSATGPGVRINGIHYWPHVPEYSPTVDRTFTSHPFQRHLRTIVRIENCGSQVLRFFWRQVNFFSNNDTLMEADSGDFVFDVASFMLFPGESRDVTVLYQPRYVAIVKQRWLLLTTPRIFFCRPSGFTLNLNGRCTPPKEYLDRLKMEKLQVILHDPRVHLEHRNLTLCPYERELEQREAFNRRNRSFQCRRHEDFERLLEFYRRIKSIHLVSFSPSWDYSVHSLIHLVCNVQDPRQRIEHLSELTQLLDGLRGASALPLGNVDTPERIRNRWHTKAIYVRGILASRLDEWEEQVQLLRSRVSKRETKDSLLEVHHFYPSKYFEDSIYIQLYRLICSAAEDIVSVVESTAQI